MKWRLFTILLVFLLAFGTLATAFAHGVELGYKTSIVVEILAAYDTGELMSGAQVMVYAPGEPSIPWFTGVCDENGRFTFMPEWPGEWVVKVRHMGHGGMLRIPIGEGMAKAGDTGYTPLQLAVMAVCVIWGFIGTALFFKRRRG
jgi:nickel transport protein